MEFFEHSVFFGVSLSLLAYGLGVVLQRRFRLALFNPLLLSVIVTILVLVTAHIDYEVYYAGAKYLSYLLTPATVCLAVPLYEKFAIAVAVCRVFRITEPIAKGVAIGSAAHALGTAKAIEIGEVEGAMSGLSIVVAGLLTVVGASVFANFL